MGNLTRATCILAVGTAALGFLACGDDVAETNTVSECVGSSTECGGSCVDTSVNPNHCGACDAACGAGEMCNSGACTLACGGGTTDCSGACIDTMNDPANCGGCGTACDAASETCVAGVCTLTCASPNVFCEGKCIDPNTDNMYCGASGACSGGTVGVTCPAGEKCNGAGACATSCAANLVDCTGMCIDPMNDPAFCGVDSACASGAACGTAEYCDQGVCEPDVAQAACPAVSPSMFTMPASNGGSTTWVRGYWFVAQSDFTITGLQVATTFTGEQNVQVVRFSSPPPDYPTVDTTFETLAYFSHPAIGLIPTCIAVSTGDIMGIVGQRDVTTDYADGPADVTIDGNVTTLTRLIHQANINTGPADSFSSDPGGDLGRIHFEYE